MGIDSARVGYIMKPSREEDFAKVSTPMQNERQTLVPKKGRMEKNLKKRERLMVLNTRWFYHIIYICSA